MKNKLFTIWKENKHFVLFILLMFMFRSAIADWNHIPSSSMKPTILIGDRILVNKMAYDIRIPFTHISLFKRSDPKRGDIIIFDSKVSGKRLVKRVIGLPGDRVALDHNVLIINGKKMAYRVENSSPTATDEVEDLPGVPHLIRIHENHASPFSSFAPVTVPEGHYLVLGDNRDNSADSRFIGFVPRKEIVGRSRSVVISLDYDNYYLPRPHRFFDNL